MNTTLISPTATHPKRVYFVDSSTQTTVDGANVEIRDETNVSIYKEHERDFREEHFPMPPHELERSVSEDDKNEPDLRSVSRSSRFVFFDKCFVLYFDYFQVRARNIPRTHQAAQNRHARVLRT